MGHMSVTRRSNITSSKFISSRRIETGRYFMMNSTSTLLKNEDAILTYHQIWVKFMAYRQDYLLERKEIVGITHTAVRPWDIHVP